MTEIAILLLLARKLHGYLVSMGRDRLMQIRTPKGFTLIELMIVIAILAMLLVVAIPAYQDLSIRARVSEGLYAAAPVKLAISEAISSGRVPGPVDFDTTGLQTEYVDSIQIANDGTGQITVATRNTGAGIDPAFTMTPSTLGSKSVMWVCALSAGESTHLPASCR